MTPNPDCVDALDFPRPIKNRSGLPHIDYRIGTYSDFREALVRSLNESPVLADWTHRESDDPGIALLEGASVLADILTFYQELYANEVYLRTARWRESVAELVRLLGYRLSPGVGGRATFAFEVKGDDAVVVPAGFRIKAELDGFEERVVFESTTEATAYPGLNAFRLYRPSRPAPIQAGQKVFSAETSTLEQLEISLEKGDRILLVRDPSDPQTARQVAVIDSIGQRFDWTELHIKGSWQGVTSCSQLQAYKLSRSFRHFGYRAPEDQITVTQPSGSQVQVNAVPVPFDQSISEPPVFPLSAEVDDISLGSIMIVQLLLRNPSTEQGERQFFERRVDAAYQGSWTLGPISGGATIIELDEGLGSEDQRYADSRLTEIQDRPYADLRRTEFQDRPYARLRKMGFDLRSMEFTEVIGEPFLVGGSFENEPGASLGTLHHFGTAKDYRRLDKREVLLKKGDGTSEATVLSIEASDADASDRFRRVYLPALTEDFSLADFRLSDEPPVTVFGNVVEATQGETAAEATWNGDSRRPFQTFPLPESPLTYLTTTGETPPEVPELEVYIDDRLWSRAASFFGHGPDEEIYIVREDFNGDSWVQFGDGQTGKRLPSGIKNVRAVFRTGTGAHGPCRQDTTVQAGGRLDRLDRIRLPGVATGGDESETADNARQAAPGKVQSLGRLVSANDFETEALAIPGVAHARAAWGLFDNIPSVQVTVIMNTGRGKEINEVERILAAFNRYRGPERFPVRVEPAERVYVYAAVDVGYDRRLRPELVRRQVKSALGVTGEEGVDGSDGLFSPTRRHLGQNEYATRVVGTVQNVHGVVWAKVRALVSLGPSDKPEKLVVPTIPPLNVELTVGSCQLLTLHAAHLAINLIETAGEEF